MNINLHIERVVLEGWPLTAAQAYTLQSAVEGELTRLLTEQGIGSISDRAVPQLSVAPIAVSVGAPPGQFGRQLARSLYDGLSPPRPERPSMTAANTRESASPSLTKNINR